jgi:hypothetical protein
MDIAIFDISHHEIADTQIRILDDGHNRMHLLVTRSMKVQLEALGHGGNARVLWQLLPESAIRHSGFVHEYCNRNKIDFLFLNTVEKHHLLFAWMCERLRSTTVLLFVHDLRSTFEPKAIKGLRHAVRRIGKIRLREAAHGYTVLLQQMKSFVLTNYRVTKPVYVVPGSIFESKTHTAIKNERLKIVVPGSVDPERRDYKSVRTVAEAAAAARWPVQFVILGSAHGDAGKSSWQLFDGLEANVQRYSERFVPVAEFEKQLEEADLIWSPLPAFFEKLRDSAESFGETKSSGAFYDAVRHGKPLLLPSRTHVSLELQEQCLVYDAAQGARDLLEKWALDESFRREVAQRALENARTFDIGSVRARLRSEGFPVST